jgi:hypothetical protein
MSGTDKITLTDHYGPTVEVSAKDIADLIATVQGLPEAVEEGEDAIEHTMGVIERRLAAMGITADRRQTADYASEGAPTPR